MTKVSFYILDAGATGDRYQLACRIADKARRAHKRVLIHSPVETECQHVDGLLWTLWEQGFVPHGRLGQGDRTINPILIGNGSEDLDEHEVLINLAPSVPDFFGRFERLIECVDHDESVKSASRERFRFYREHGYPLTTHTVT